MSEIGGRSGRNGRGTWWALAGLLLALTGSAVAAAQTADEAEGRTIRRIEVRGLQRISEGFVRSSIKSRPGQKYLRDQVQEDVRSLLRTRKFLDVQAAPEFEEDEVVLVVELREKPAVTAIEIVGNKRFTDEELFKQVTFSSAEPLDRYEIQRSRENIADLYREKGNYYVDVTVDERLLEQEGRVVFAITEGPQVRVRKILFEGNRSFSRQRLRPRVKTDTYIWLLRRGAFDEDQAERDALSLQQYYRDEGFLDARVGYRLDFDEVDRSDLRLVFVIDEGPRYRVAEIQPRGNEVFSNARVLEVIQIVPGDFVRSERLEADVKRVQDLYGEIGYVDRRVRTTFDYLDEPGVVNVNFEISEGDRATVGRITVRGNLTTKDEVVRREVRFYPGEDFNLLKAQRAERRLLDTSLFRRATITPLPDLDNDGVREALVEVEEAEAINFIVGVGVSTDAGVLGSISLTNRNFDLFDWPRTWGELFRGRAFRGDGQRLRLQAEPGTELTRFRIDFTEPYLFDYPLRYDHSLFLFQRGREGWLEERLGTTFGLSRRFITGLLDGWAVEGALRFEVVTVDNVQAFAPSDIRDARGDSFVTSVKGTIVRDTTDSRIIPSEGYRVAFSWEQVGALGGDYAFGKPGVSGAYYRTIKTDALDRKSVLAFRGDVGYIVGNAPVFERYFGGGFGSLRGFRFRGISPRKGLYNNPVGGDLIVLAGAEYQFPVFGQNIRGVTFVDMGTVEEGFEITTWRVSVGAGLRINIDFFGPVPLVLDFGFPVAKSPEDDTQVFNFSFGASF